MLRCLVALNKCDFFVGLLLVSKQVRHKKSPKKRLTLWGIWVKYGSFQLIVSSFYLPSSAENIFCEDYQPLIAPPLKASFAAFSTSSDW